MAIHIEQVQFAFKEEKRLATRAGSPFSVEILEGRDTVVLQQVKNGVIGSPFFSGNYVFLKRGQTIPWGSVRAAASDAATTIRIKVRSGRDFTGVPEFQPS